jgi:molecular chaperone DnaK (HSP70)
LTNEWVPKVIAAIDFGTHGSGYAWAPVADIDAGKSFSYSYYPGSLQHYPKNLSAVLVTADGDLHSWGHEAREKWKTIGVANPDGYGYASRFKMAIRADATRQDVPEFAGSASIRDRETVRRMVVHLLRVLREQVLGEIAARRFRAGRHDVVYSPEDVRWCVTIPAIWESHERDFMRQAAIEAGLPDDDDRMMLAIEPEAAAVYCAFEGGNNLSQDERDRIDLGLVGSRFMVVDCGGGTVDISAYRVVTTQGERHGLSEVGLPNGGKLGSEYINEAFRGEFLPRRFGARAMARIEAQHGPALLTLEQEWERIKIGLPHSDDASGRPVIDADRVLPIYHEIWSALGWRARRRLRRGDANMRIPLPRAQMQALFDPLVDGIIDCVEQQLVAMRDADGEVARDETTRERLLLVGGFAKSSYLQARLTRHFAGRADVIVAREPAVAVLAGAVRFANDPSVIWARRSKYTYGFNVWAPARPGVDAPLRQEPGDHGEARVLRFVKVVTRGETVPVGSPVASYTLQPFRRTDREITVTVSKSVAADPQYPDEAGVKGLGQVTVPLHDSIDEPPEERSVELSILAGDTVLEVHVMHKKSGREYRCSVNFEEGYPR